MPSSTWHSVLFPLRWQSHPACLLFRSVCVWWWTLLYTHTSHERRPQTSVDICLNTCSGCAARLLHQYIIACSLAPPFPTGAAFLYWLPMTSATCMYDTNAWALPFSLLCTAAVWFRSGRCGVSSKLMGLGTTKYQQASMHMVSMPGCGSTAWNNTRCCTATVWLRSGR